MALPFTPVGSWFGFEAPPFVMLAGIGIIVVVYLMTVELLKPWAIGDRRASGAVDGYLRMP